MAKSKKKGRDKRRRVALLNLEWRAKDYKRQTGHDIDEAFGADFRRIAGERRKLKERLDNTAESSK